MAVNSTTIVPTPTRNRSLAPHIGGFETITEALDYAAQGETGYNFFDLRGEPSHVLPYADLRARAVDLANRLAARFERGDRLAMIAETSPDFIITFFACQYAGLIPAPMPMPVNLGGKDGYILQVRQMVSCAGAAAAIGPATLCDFLKEATADVDGVEVFSFDDVYALKGNGAATFSIRRVPPARPRASSARSAR